jgi:hypothetical protein
MRLPSSSTQANFVASFVGLLQQPCVLLGRPSQAIWQPSHAQSRLGKSAQLAGHQAFKRSLHVYPHVPLRFLYLPLFRLSFALRLSACGTILLLDAYVGLDVLTGLCPSLSLAFCDLHPWQS